jgi:hypothetical protein
MEATTSTRKKVTHVYPVSLATSARKEGADVAGREQIREGKKHRNRKGRCKHRPRKEIKVIHRMFGRNSFKERGVWRTAEEPDCLKRRGRPLLHNGYNTIGVCIVVTVTIVNEFTRQHIHRQMFPAKPSRICRYNG